MKKLFLLLVFPITCIGIQAQGVSYDYGRSSYHSSNKLINDALQRGRQARQFYQLQNTKGKVLDGTKLRRGAIEEGFIVGSYTTKNINRFGDVTEIINTMAFIPRDEFPEYVFEHVASLTSTNNKLHDLKKGECWLIINSKFERYSGVYWTGAINNGRLNGRGTAFFFDDEYSRFMYAKGEFQNGLPLGAFQVNMYVFKSTNPEEVRFNVCGNANVGQFYDNMAKFSFDGGKWGFVNNEGKIAISPVYDSVIKEFSNGRAEVSKDGQEIIIGSTGNMIDLTAKQKQIDAAKKAKERQETLKQEQERKRQEIANRQKKIEEERIAREREKYRVERIKKCQPGDKIYYSKDYSKSESFFGFTYSHSSWTMRVVCFVEQNINHGERLQIRVGSVESSSSYHYTQPEIDGMKYSKGDVFWIKPLKDSNWWIE